jgi:hypothetical protein
MPSNCGAMLFIPRRCFFYRDKDALNRASTTKMLEKMHANETGFFQFFKTKMARKQFSSNALFTKILTLN